MAVTPTIYDVSRLSGVSIATVSRAFSDPDKVREKTRKKVYEAAEVLHYSPNAIARAMARQRTDKIAYLICKQGATILDEFYAGICEGIMQTANRSDYQLLISTADDWKQTVGNAQSKQIEGVILGGDAQAELIAELQSQNVAVVLVNNYKPGLDIPCVVSDERDGVRQAIEHLYNRGHRHIAMIAGRFNPYIIGARYNAFLEVMAEYGLSVDAADVEMCKPTVEKSTKAAMKLLSRSDRPTAVFGSNDVMAAGVFKAASKLGLRIPEDVAVVGFDNSSICPVFEPELTSVHVNCRRMGEICVEYLAALLNNKNQNNIQRLTIVPPTLVVRSST